MKANTEIARTLAAAIPGAVLAFAAFVLVFSFPWSLGSESFRMIAPWFTFIPAIIFAAITFVVSGNAIKARLTPTGVKSSDRKRVFIIYALLIGTPLGLLVWLICAK